MAVQIIHHLGKELGRIFAPGRRRLVRTDKEYLVHAHVKGVRTEAVENLVDQLEDNFVHLGIERVPFAAIDALFSEKAAGVRSNSGYSVSKGKVVLLQD